MILLLSLLACQDPPAEPEVQADPGDYLVPLDAPLLLRRVSLDTRGVLPSAEELDAVEADPSKVDTYRDQFMDDERFEDRLVSLFAERWLTRLDKFEIQYYDYQLDPELEFEFERSVGEEPLRLMARIAMLDKPWTDVVTANYTVANETLASLWPLSYPEGGSGWELSSYTDGRPAVGVLATNGLWWRYVTNISNMNRSRAAAIMRLLLCQDVLSRPVSLSGQVSISDEDGIADAIANNPSCIACHASVDPLASALFGWWTVISYNPDEMGSYHAEREELGGLYLGSDPAFFGQALNGFVDLGPAIANDSRFYSCTAKSAAELFWRRPLEEGDWPRVEDLRDEFLGDGLLYRDLVKAVMDTPEYKAGTFVDDAPDEALEREITWRLITPDLMASMVADLTGFVWEYEGFEQLANDDPGYRTLAGGVDGYSVTRAQQDPGITWTVTAKRFAQAAASYAVEQELVQGGERRLFQVVTLEDRPGDEAFTNELEALHWRMYAVRVDDERRGAAEALWTAVEAEEGAQVAWTRLISAMLRDPDFIGY